MFKVIWVYLYWHWFRTLLELYIGFTCNIHTQSILHFVLQRTADEDMPWTCRQKQKLLKCSSYIIYIYIYKYTPCTYVSLQTSLVLEVCSNKHMLYIISPLDLVSVLLTRHQCCWFQCFFNTQVYRHALQMIAFKKHLQMNFCLYSQETKIQCGI